MSVDCGSQIAICDMPIHFDNYIGCSHACEYCFVKRFKDIKKIKPVKGSYNSLKGFTEGNRQRDTFWCDWDIPIHWGGMSDPFQPIEKNNKQNIDSTYNILKLLAETKYPIVISTKGKLCIDKEYLELLKQCNVVMQISCVSKYYDNIEKGAPTYIERLNMIETLSKNVQRVIVRCQPYLPQVKHDILKNSLNDFKNSGAYGVIFEGMKFFVGENRLRQMGDSLCCCGCADLFQVNTFNCNHLLNGDKTEPTESMKVIGTGSIFHALDQSRGTYERQKNSTMEELMLEECTLKRTQQALGKI